MRFVIRSFIALSLFIGGMIGFGYFFREDIVMTTPWWRALLGPFAIYTYETPEHPVKDYAMTTLMSAGFIVPCFFQARWDRVIWRFFSFCGIFLWYFFGLAAVTGWTW